ncbi:glycosyltransferase family 2 protein [Candidatus Chlorohelix sp.]|uniref:glycosyltransferase family 2 protein n=1 Tax=Candidatus Chlorohelix sp. TaxID=3139201 RepID=UPI00306FF589
MAGKHSFELGYMGSSVQNPQTRAYFYQNTQEYSKIATITIVCFNHSHHIEACLSSVLKTLPADCEVIVVDNASTDGSAELVEKHFPQFRLIKNKVNEGFAGANNTAFKEAHGRYLVALNPDTVVNEGWLEALVAPFKEAETGLTTARIMLMQQPSQANTCGNEMHFTGITTCRGLGWSLDEPELYRSTIVPAISGACFAIRAELWKELGGFDPTFFTYLEDTDLSLRVRLSGYKCIYVPDSVIYHDYTNKFSSRKLYFLERNRLLLLLKCYSMRSLLLLLPALLLAEALVWGYAFTHGTTRSILEAYGWVFMHRKEILQKRRIVKSYRRINDYDLFREMQWRLSIGQLSGPTLAKLADLALNPLFWLTYKAFQLKMWR